MLAKDIASKLPIQFEYVDEDYEVNELEYCKLVKVAYINEVKYKKGNVNEVLKEEYNKIDDMLIPISNIQDIVFIEEGFLARRQNSKEINSFIVMEDDTNMFIYIISTGEDHSYDIDDEVIYNEDKIKILYDINEEDYQDDIKFGRVDNIKLYKDTIIKNEVSNRDLVESDVLVIKDKFDKEIIVDILRSRIYSRLDSFGIKETDNTKVVTIYEYGKRNKVKRRTFSNFKFSLLDLFTEEVD